MRRQASGAVRELVLDIFSLGAARREPGENGRAEAARQRRNEAGQAVVGGIRLAARSADLEELLRRWYTVEPEHRAFALEGIGIGLATQSASGSRPQWRSLILRLSEGEAVPVCVGVGWAEGGAAPVDVANRANDLDPVLSAAVADGFGFGYTLRCHRLHRGMAWEDAPPGLTGYAARAFDRGVGRCLWFIERFDPVHVATAVDRLPPLRRPDIWMGVGTACAHVGGAGRDALCRLTEKAGRYGTNLASGVAWTAWVRAECLSPSPYTELACSAIWDCSTQAAAGIVAEARASLGPARLDARYERWCEEIGLRWQPHLAGMSETAETRKEAPA